MVQIPLVELLSFAYEFDILSPGYPDKPRVNASSGLTIGSRPRNAQAEVTIPLRKLRSYLFASYAPCYRGYLEHYSSFLPGLFDTPGFRTQASNSTPQTRLPDLGFPCFSFLYLRCISLFYLICHPFAEIVGFFLVAGASEIMRRPPSHCCLPPKYRYRAPPSYCGLVASEILISRVASKILRYLALPPNYCDTVRCARNTKYRTPDTVAPLPHRIAALLPPKYRAGDFFFFFFAHGNRSRRTRMSRRTLNFNLHTSLLPRLVSSAHHPCRAVQRCTTDLALPQCDSLHPGVQLPVRCGRDHVND